MTEIASRAAGSCRPDWNWKTAAEDPPMLAVKIECEDGTRIEGNLVTDGPILPVLDRDGKPTGEVKIFPTD